MGPSEDIDHGDDSDDVGHGDNVGEDYGGILPPHSQHWHRRRGEPEKGLQRSSFFDTEI